MQIQSLVELTEKPAWQSAPNIATTGIATIPVLAVILAPSQPIPWKHGAEGTGPESVFGTTEISTGPGGVPGYA